MNATPPSEARRVGEAALDWVSAHRDRFALGDDALAADGQVNRTWKPLGELAQVCATVSLQIPPSDPLHPCVSDLLDFAWEQTGRGELFLRMQALEPFATYPLEVYAAFASAGFRHPGYEASAALVARTRSWRLTEQYPTRRLGVMEAERRGGITPHGQVPQALSRTWLGGLPEPWTFERAAGYALTHVVFHLTDWGRAVQGVPPDLATYLLHWLPPWLDTCLDARMWDLSCELLAVAVSLPRLTEPAVLQDAWHRVAAAQHTSGAIPEEGVMQDAAHEAGLETAPDPYDFTDCYHSTLMAAYAAALTTARPADTDEDGGRRKAARGPAPTAGHTHERQSGQGVPA
ncbi:hypothetical protein GCM10010377_66620 [Streptomyces viridiviolaceus]|uniref:DUF6895 family protein n=1 Tax=Streptomyces viridiviolaceus TaxID=68282 RepID=A0ABW2EBW4_9ACTN|nr:hypothetical protein [Streptomyces viridiviolaceus]GHB66353.1 hypothetical protein GCM10010377_66620 [Streptomyces viridiviolaceus]